MTPSPLPTHLPSPETLVGPDWLGDIYAILGPEQLVAHARMIVAQLAEHIPLSGEALAALDPLEEALAEHLARTDPLALRRTLARAGAGLAEPLA